MSNSTARPWKTYRRLLSYTRPVAHLFFFSFLAFALYSGTQTLFFKVLELFIKRLEGKPVDAWVHALPPALVQSVLLIPVLVVVLSIARGVGAYYGNYLISRVGLQVVNTLRKQVYDHLLIVPQRYHDERNSGQQISLLIYNVEQVSTSVTRAVMTLLEEGLFLVGLLIYLLWTNWKLTLIFLIAAPILSLLVAVAAQYFRKVSRNIQRTVGRVSHIANETLQGIQTVKSYNAEQVERARFHQAADEVTHYSQKYQRVSALQSPILHSVIAVALAIIFFLVMLIWPAGESASAVAFVSAAAATAKPLKQLSTINSIIQRGLTAAETIFAAIDTPPERDMGSAVLKRAKGAIEFDQVSFHYEPENPVIKELSLSIAPGESVALVGQSGSGKTTIASLLLRFYDIDSGALRIDGVDINQLPLSSLRRNIALVRQNPALFDTSIKENIYYGSDQRNEAQLIQALKDANAWDFVQKLDGGVDATVGEGGSLLSGGQRQRIAIARALYKNAPILILDEATSALDNESEKLIQTALNRLKRGRTTLIIAHRLSTVRDADTIVVLKHGEIVESGRHDDLLRLNGAYAALYQSQDENA